MTTELRQGVASATDGGSMLQLEDVHKRFGELHVLRGVDLEVDAARSSA